MRILALDASTETCAVALGDGVSWRERSEIAGQRHSELLLPMIRALLAELGVTLAQLDGIAFGAGPGSFTGLRIACGVAQGLALGAGLPVVGVSTLEAMAETRAPQLRRQTGSSPRSMRGCARSTSRAYERDLGALARGHRARRRRPGRGADCPRAASWIGAGSGFAAYPVAPRALRRSRFPHVRTDGRARRDRDRHARAAAFCRGRRRVARAMPHPSTCGIAWR